MRTTGTSMRGFAQVSDIDNKPIKINFIAPFRLAQTIKVLAREGNQTQSDIIRRALEFFIARYEQDKLAREMKQACENYREFNRKFSSEWAQFETRIE